MFEALYDELSRLWSWRWPIAQGEIISVQIERVRHGNSSSDTLRLSVVYSFSVGYDGPYGGESFWSPAFSIGAIKRLRQAKRKLRVGLPVPVRYPPDDPSLNRLDRSAWEEL
jgi:hypothetical protein